MNIATIIGLAIKCSIFFIAMGYGLHATPSQAFSLFRNPGKLLRSLFSMHVVLLLFAILVALKLDLPKYVNVTLLALAVSPLPPLFPKKSLQAGGRESYTIGLIVATCLFSLILIPFSLEMLERIFHKPVNINTKAIFMAALLTVIIPFSLGITMHQLAPEFAQKLRDKLLKTGQILLLVAILPVLFMMFPTIKSLIGDGTILALAGFAVVGLVAGHLLGGPVHEDRTVLALASASRHPGIAIAIASANITEHKIVIATVIMFLVVSAIVGIPYLKWAQRDSEPPPDTGIQH